MKVFQPGTRVHVGPQHQPLVGMVNKVMIEGKDAPTATYKVSWWDGRTRKEEWFENHEVRQAGSNQPSKIGFHTNKEK